MVDLGEDKEMMQSLMRGEGNTLRGSEQEAVKTGRRLTVVCGTSFERHREGPLGTGFRRLRPLSSNGSYLSTAD